MSTTTSPGLTPGALDVSGTPRVPLGRLVQVELRKMVDTRAGQWLLGIIAFVTLAAVVIFGLAANDGDKTFFNFAAFTGTPQGFLLPVMAILLITQEWGQRTAMVTFTLEPHRGRVLIAKVAGALIIGLAAFTLALVLALAATAVFGGAGAFDDFTFADMGVFGLLQVLGILQGLAFGLLFLNSAVAIVMFFVLPTIFGILSEVWASFRDIAPWVDFGTAQLPLFDGAAGVTGQEWARLGVTMVIWVFLPLAVGAARMLRSELK